MSLFNKIFGDPNEKYLKKLEPMVGAVSGLSEKYKKMSDKELKGLASVWREELKGGKSLDDLIPEVFAATREVSARHMGTTGHFDCQMIGAKVLHEGKIAELKTGEGKTSYVVSPPAILNALEGKGVHIVTVNDYLSKRDASWVGGVYDRLGLSVGVIVHEEAFRYKNTESTQNTKTQDEGDEEKEIRNKKLEIREDSSKAEALKDNKKIVSESGEEGAGAEVLDDFLVPVERKEAYNQDITYGTNNEFGFDYLRDNMAQTLETKVQRGLNYAIVDEIDSILIDEARTPLIISAPAQEAGSRYELFSRLIPRLKEGEDYNIDEKMRAATLTEEGIKKMEEWLGVTNIYTEKGIKEVHHMEQALKAQVLFKREKDYVVKDGEVVIVDEFTGRMMYGRRYSEGLHQAIEAKEGVAIKQESITMATVTFQNYFRMYKKLSGITGTALTEAEEFSKIYALDVIAIPTNKPVIRKDLPDRIYKTEEAKFNAVIKDIKERSEKGQPVLVGTISIEKNELLSELLKREGVEHNVLNAKQHEKEGQIVAQAGKKGTVTLATNMAGRGVDIILGGEKSTPHEAQEIKDLGGLAVIGTERHESRRIDNQLRGRSGRQGDPGSSQFYASCDDDLMRIFGGTRMKSLMETLKLPDDMPIEHGLISKSIESAQKKVEGHNFDIRKHLVEYDDVINKHREIIYKKRDNILETYGVLKGDTKTQSVEVSGDKIQNTINKKQGNTNFVETPHRENADNGGKADKLENVEAPQGVDETSLLKDIIVEMVESEITGVVNFHTADEDENRWNIDEIYETMDTIFPVPLEVRLKMDDVQKMAGDEKKDILARKKLTDYLIDLAKKAYGDLENKINDNEELKKQSPKPMLEIENMILLRAYDLNWVEHIDAMDHLRTGIGLRGYGQRDPLVEYKREAYRMFKELQANIRKQVVYSIYKVGMVPVPVQQQRQNLQMKGAAKDGEEIEKLRNEEIKGINNHNNVSVARPAKIGAVSSSVAQSAPVGKKQEKKVGRNEPCPCGSGKKYKKCCGS